MQFMKHATKSILHLDWNHATPLVDPSAAAKQYSLPTQNIYLHNEQKCTLFVSAS